jgi:predicted Zn finger-like uncharacterized protein
MAEEQYTRCPSCTTIFRVTPEQLTLREGKVRCGHCRTVFNGVEHLISLAPVPRSEGDEDVDELLKGPPTITLRSARALQPIDDEGPADNRRGREPTMTAPPEPEVDYDSRFAWDKPKPPSRARRVAGAIAIPVLLVLLAAQAIFHFRDAIAARVPVTRPALTRICAAAGCEIRPLRDVAGLSIDASDLQADPAHRGLLILSATIRNRASYALAFPYLELTLTDSGDKIVVRRALAPTEYAGGTTDIAGGIPPNGEVAVKLFLDASATTQAGYHIYLFYP